MANAIRPTPQPRHSKLVRTIAIVLLTLMVLTGLAVLIIWLSVKPKRPVYTIEDASIHGYNLTNNHLNATFNFVIRAYNPNSKVSIYYDKVEVSVSYDDQKLASSSSVNAFFQPHQNATHLKANLVAQNVSLYGAVANDLRLEKAAGEVELDVRMKAKVRFKVGSWKSRRRTLKIFCSPVIVHLSSSKGFQRVFCDMSL